MPELELYRKPPPAEAAQAAREEFIEQNACSPEEALEKFSRVHTPSAKEEAPGLRTLESRAIGQQVLRMTIDGYTIDEIADATGLSVRDVKRFRGYMIQRMHKADSFDSVKRWRALAVEKLRSVQKRCFEKFDGKDELEIVKGRPFGKGNPAYLKVILEAERGIAAMLGLNAPKQIKIDEKRRIEVEEVLVLTREDAERQLQALEADSGTIIDADSYPSSS